MKSMDDDLLVLSPERTLEEEREKDDDEDVKRIKPYSKKTMEEFDIGNGCHGRTTKEICTYAYAYFDTTPRGKPYTSKKGIALTLEKWKNLTEDCIGDIDKALDDLKKEDANVSYKEHLGHNVPVTVEQEYGFVYIRKWWLPENTEMIVATRKSVSLPVAMWKELKKTIPVIRKRFQKELDSIRYC